MKSFKHIAFVLLIFALLPVLSACQNTAASHSSTSSVPTGSASSAAGLAEQPQRLGAVPAKQILEYPSHIVFNGANGGHTLVYSDGNEAHSISLPLPTETVGAVCFASKQVLSVVGVSEDRTKLHGATSQNNGQSWDTFELTLPKESPPSNLEMGFTSYGNGWLACNVSETDTYLLYRTADGGITWDFAQTMALPYSGATFTFASSDIGWATFTYCDAAIPQIYETADGGKTWNLARVDLEAEMLEGAEEFVAGPVSWQDDHWAFSAMAIKQPGYPGSPSYSFSWCQDTLSWRWDNPHWPMPEGVSQIHFLDYVQEYAYPPVAYDAELGLDEQTASLWLIFDAADLHTRTTGESLVGATIPYQLVNRMAEYQYGDASFDARLMEYPYGSDEEGFVNYEGHWPKGEGEAIVIVLDVSVLDDGNIEAIVMQVHAPEPGDDTAEDEVDRTFQRSIFKPIWVDDIPFFTLLYAEPTSPIPY